MKPVVDDGRNTAVLPLPGAERLPELLDFGGLRFARKRELHATLAGSRDRFSPAAMREAARGLTFRVRPLGRYRLVVKGERRSLIELVDIDGFAKYRARLSAAPLPPAHVTLFTEPGGGGIALYTLAELQNLSREADLRLASSPWRLDGDGAILGA